MALQSIDPLLAGPPGDSWFQRTGRAFSRALVLMLEIGTLSIQPARAQMAPPKLMPERIAMGAFYDGARMRIEGKAPSDSGVLVVIRGADKDEFFNRKGRVGVIWLNVDKIHVKRAPSFFLSLSSAPVDSLLDRASLDAQELDQTAIQNRMLWLCHCKCSLTGGPSKQRGEKDTQPDSSYRELLRSDFFKLKEQEGSYRTYPGAVTLASLADPATSYAAEFPWPRLAPAGDYQVEVYACRGRKVIASSTATLQVVEVGFPAYMANSASQHPWTYGAGAVLIAMLAGFGTDAVTAWLRRRKRGGTGRRPLEKGGAGPGAPIDSKETEVVHRG